MSSADAIKRAGRVVVLDDHDQLRQMLCVALQVGGFETLEAATPAEAYRYLAGPRTPQVLVISLQDADRRGLEVLRYVRAHEHLVEMPIVFLAPQSTDDLRWQALKAGADWFAHKPLSLRDLQHHVAELIRQGRPRQRALNFLKRQQHRLAG
jgi:DNA-binding response OmpR family regulator